MEFVILENTLNPITDCRSIRNYCFIWDVLCKRI